MQKPLLLSFGIILFILLFAVRLRADTAVNGGYEIEPNNTPATATALPANVVKITGEIMPAADVDYYSFNAVAGDRVYAAVMTAASPDGQDSVLTLFASDGTTVIETDDDDGSFGSSSSSIAGAVIPSTGTYYLQVRALSVTSRIRPYDLWVSVRSAGLAAEVGPNNTIESAEPLSSVAWISGSASAASDTDAYSLNLNAGDSVFLSLDLDPERDATELAAQLGFGLFAGVILFASDAGHAGPDSEAHFMTVKEAGTYYITVLPAAAGTYNLSATVLPAPPLTFTTYTSTNVPQIIPTGPGMVSSTINIPDDKRVGRIKVFLDLNHTNPPDLDLSLTAPDGNTVGLLTDIGSSSYPNWNFGLDDSAAIPVNAYGTLSGQIFRPETNYRLDWFRGERAQGTWTLTIRDDVSSNGGTLFGWSLAIADDSPPAGAPLVIYTNDFEAGDGGFTHSGVQDEWQRGLPASNPITNCHSGLNCWKTDLTGNYNANATNDLVSPNIDLTSFKPGDLAVASWAMKFQFERSLFDGGFVEVQEVGGSGATRKLWEWSGFTMADTQGGAAETIQEAAGWGLYRAQISDFAGKMVRLRFHFESDSSFEYAGMAVDDVAVAVYPKIVKSGNDYAVNFRAAPGRMYQVQYATSLNSPIVWNLFNPPAVVLSPESGVFSYTNANPTNVMRFYRIVPYP